MTWLGSNIFPLNKPYILILFVLWVGVGLEGFLRDFKLVIWGSNFFNWGLCSLSDNDSNHQTLPIYPSEPYESFPRASLNTSKILIHSLISNQLTCLRCHTKESNWLLPCPTLHASSGVYRSLSSSWSLYTVFFLEISCDLDKYYL